jgi:PAS domain-containing protein
MSPPSVHRIEDSRRFELLLNSIVDYAIFMLDAEGRVETWNAGAKALKGYSAEKTATKAFQSVH